MAITNMNINVDTIDGYAAYINSDLTEGRGYQYPLAISLVKTTCERIGAGKHVQGGDAEIITVKLFKIEDMWYGPIKLEYPSVEDTKIEMDLLRRTFILEKARRAGLSDEEINVLKGSQ